MDIIFLLIPHSLFWEYYSLSKSSILWKCSKTLEIDLSIILNLCVTFFKWLSFSKDKLRFGHETNAMWSSKHFIFRIRIRKKLINIARPFRGIKSLKLMFVIIEFSSLIYGTSFSRCINEEVFNGSNSLQPTLVKRTFWSIRIVY